jgi:hypothetical protein
MRLAMLLAAVLVVLAGCSAGPPPIEDPKEIVTRSLEAMQDTESFHMRVDVAGSAPLDLAGTGSDSNSLPLDGTNIEMDVDVAGQKADLTFAIPPLFGLTGDVVVLGDTMYVRMPLLGPKWLKQSASDLGGEVPLPSPSADTGAAMAELMKILEDPKVAPKKLADEKCGSKDCYRVQMTIPTDELAGEVQGALASAAPLPSGLLPSELPDVTIDMWVEKDTMRIAKVAVAAAMDPATPITATVTFSKWNEPVTVEAPPPDQVDESGGGLLDNLMPSFAPESP